MNSGYEVETVFEHEGLKCVVIISRHTGHRCGYVGINKLHPLYGVDYSQKNRYLKVKCLRDKSIGKRGIIPIFCRFNYKDRYSTPDVYFDVHGGLTYSNDGNNNYPIESKNTWWFGYDCGHAGDEPDLSFIEDEKVREIYSRFSSSYGTIKNTEYCIEECKSLAEQLAKIRFNNRAKNKGIPMTRDIRRKGERRAK